MTLHLFVIPHSVEETLRTVLNLYEGSRSILIHLKPVDASHNLVLRPLNLTDVMSVECVVLHEVGMIRISRLVLITSSVVRIEGLPKVVLCEDHILGCETRMFNLMVDRWHLLCNISAILRREVLSIFQDLLRRSVPHQNLNSLVLLGLTLKRLRTVLLPEFLNEFRLTLESNTDSTRNGRSTNAHLGDA